jgi:predicted Fe-Mo cluster-binding NifX family protein
LRIPKRSLKADALNRVPETNIKSNNSAYWRNSWLFSIFQAGKVIMKIAVSADGPDLDSKVGQRLGTSPYLIIFDLKSGEYEAVPNTWAAGHRGAGLPILMLADKKEVKAVITGFCSPAMRDQFKNSGIDILTGISGVVEEAVRGYERSELNPEIRPNADTSEQKHKKNKISIANAFRISTRQFIHLLPVLTGVILLLGLFNAVVSKSFLASIFGGNMLLDSVWGACLGGILAGNPINSYVLGEELLKNGISLFAVTALIVTWVTVGLIQLPAEAAALGKKFALLRNVFSFLLSIPIAIATVLLANIVTG